MAKIANLKDRSVRVEMVAGKGYETRLLLPDGTDLARYAQGFRVEQNGPEPPCVWIKFFAETVQVAAAPGEVSHSVPGVVNHVSIPDKNPVGDVSPLTYAG